MGRFDVSSIRYLDPEHFRVLLAVCIFDLKLKINLGGNGNEKS